MWRAWVAVAAALFSAGCGSIGQPLPPALHVPQRVLDLSATQQGDKILVRFTVPARTTENLIIQKPVTADLGIGPVGTPFVLAVWDASAKHFTDIPTEKPEVRYAVPAGVWIGKDVVIAVRILSDKDRTAGWSNQVTLSVVAPLAPPTGLIQQEVSEGIRLTWQGDAPMYRVFRRVDADEKRYRSRGNRSSHLYRHHYRISENLPLLGGGLSRRRRRSRVERPDACGECHPYRQVAASGSHWPRRHRVTGKSGTCLGSEYGARPGRLQYLPRGRRRLSHRRLERHGKAPAIAIAR